MKMFPQTNQTTLFKLLVIFASALLSVLFVVGIIQTFVLKGALKQQDNLQQQEQLIDTEISQREKDTQFLTTEEGEVIIKN